MKMPSGLMDGTLRERMLDRHSRWQAVDEARTDIVGIEEDINGIKEKIEERRERIDAARTPIGRWLGGRAISRYEGAIDTHQERLVAAQEIKDERREAAMLAASLVGSRVGWLETFYPEGLSEYEEFEAELGRSRH